MIIQEDDEVLDEEMVEIDDETDDELLDEEMVETDDETDEVEIQVIHYLYHYLRGENDLVWKGDMMI
jgi:hypothetical protein